jgi:hypothetical protein
LIECVSSFRIAGDRGYEERPDGVDGRVERAGYGEGEDKGRESVRELDDRWVEAGVTVSFLSTLQLPRV